jgi:hypothetical protein
MFSIWGTSEAEKAVIEAGGIRVPRNATDDFHKIIKTAFSNMQDSFDKYNIVLDPLLLEEIEIFEVEILNHFTQCVKNLKKRTSNNKVLTQEMAMEAVGDDVKRAFVYFSTLISDCKFDLSRQAKIIMRRVERHVFINTTNHINDWHY